MFFSLIDRIESLVPGHSVVATKSLSLAEEYLRDHFPKFPVMPGVLMLEALTQAAAWLVRVTDDFSHSIVVLKEARNVKYGKFVKPGQTIRITADIIEWTDTTVTLKAEGIVDDQPTLRAKLILVRYNLGNHCQGTDSRVVDALKSQLTLLWSEWIPEE